MYRPVNFLSRFKILNCRKFVTFVPKHPQVSDSDISQLQNFLNSYKGHIVVLTGAGVSTESGIPDYRSEVVGLYARSNHKPTTYQEFAQSSKFRKRYWARSFVGWNKFSTVNPNSTHTTLTQLEKDGYISYIVTQNVDNLHQKAGSKRVVELHGTLNRVSCMSCNSSVSRNEFQIMLKELNSHFELVISEALRPDGDVDLPNDVTNSFKIPSCSRCGGDMKPKVVFFGENVPRKRSEDVKKIVHASRSLLILGSSLSVFSAYRIVLQAIDASKAVFIVNIGKTRADHLATVKLDVKCGDIVPSTYKMLPKRIY